MSQGATQHIAPRWGLGTGRPQHYKHLAPLGPGPRHCRRLGNGEHKMRVRCRASAPLSIRPAAAKRTESTGEPGAVETLRARRRQGLLASLLAGECLYRIADGPRPQRVAHGKSLRLALGLGPLRTGTVRGPSVLSLRVARLRRYSKDCFPLPPEGVAFHREDYPFSLRSLPELPDPVLAPRDRRSAQRQHLRGMGTGTKRQIPHDGNGTTACGNPDRRVRALTVRGKSEGQQVAARGGSSGDDVGTTSTA